MRKIICIISALMILPLSQCTNNVSGSAQQGEAKVIGIIETAEGIPVTGTPVELLPSDFNPVIDSINWARTVAYQTFTDDSGKFEIVNVEKGSYILNSTDTLKSKHIYIPNIIVENDNIDLGIKKFKNNSFVTLSISDSVLNTNSYLYIEGTSFFTKIDTSNIITFEIPVDTITISFISIDSGKNETIYENITVTEGDTLDISGVPNAPSLPQNDTIFTDTLYVLKIDNYSDTLAYRIYWGDGDTTQWTADTVFQKNWSNPGIYAINAQAKTTNSKTLYSNWSNDFIVTVLQKDSLTDTTNNDSTNTDTINTPNTPIGNDTVSQSISETYSTTIWGDNNNMYEFRFDWGDSSQSIWSSDTFAIHDWLIDSIPKSFQIKAQARLKTDTSNTSDWSGSLNVYVTF